MNPIISRLFYIAGGVGVGVLAATHIAPFSVLIGVALFFAVIADHHGY